MKYFLVLVTLFCFVALPAALFNGCKKRDRFYATPLNFSVPQGFPQPAYNFRSNPTTEEGFVLGRKLFYEGRLSIDGNFPCSSCHQQIAGFTTKDHDLGHGYNNSHTTRNPVGLANLAWFTAYYQDGATASLEKIAQDHITSPTEMAQSLEAGVAKLKGDTTYRRLFREAFGDENITSARILQSLAQFVVNLVSADSKYDKVKRGTASFTTQEQRGYAVFQQHCNSCHTEPLFTDLTYRNIGLPLSPQLQDYGRMRVTGSPADSLKFRVPSLRNVFVTSHYTHDGSIGTVRGMVNHYRSGIVQSATLDPSLRGGLPLSNAETDDVLAFLRTLTDSSYLLSPRFRP